MLYDDSKIRRYYFDLSESTPVHVISNIHEDADDSWFDMHYEVEVGIVIKGKMKREYLNYKYDIGEGQAWLCASWEPHGFEIIEHPCEVLVFVAEPAHLMHSSPFSFDLLQPFMTPPSKRPQVQQTSDMKSLALKAKEKINGDKNSDWAKLLFFEAMLLLNDQWNNETEIEFSYDNHQSIQPALRLVFEEKRLIRTKEAAKKCNLSLTAFKERFQDLMETTFSEFALQYRVRGAKSDLKNSNATQQTIAREWGFTDASHLHKYLNKLK